MKIHKRRKRTRARGQRTMGWGFRQKHKGHGNKGIFASGGVRHRPHLVKLGVKKAKLANIDYFGKQGLTSRSTFKKKYDKINLDDIKANFFKKDGEKLDFSEYKILGDGVGFKAEITAKSATEQAIQKMEKAGGKIILPVKKVVEDKKENAKKVEVKKEEKAAPKKEAPKKEEKVTPKKKVDKKE